ncbi:hypothetical protein [Thermospira aquatica]|uniref:Uncharacterized protein n=1 Tax=Thermospira aquatica TaxID=2828656 RepID=A0AAX3BD21_9SPIR|nr:hypothetical protein [Thermospira aquatica]URA09993.1 hypothetical protein KDW03_11005 [Thermospira aquatica]
MAEVVSTVKVAKKRQNKLVRGVVPAAKWYEPVGFLFLGYLAIFLVILLPILFSFMLSVYDIRNSNIRMVLNKIGINIFALPFAKGFCGDIYSFYYLDGCKCVLPCDYRDMACYPPQ